MTPTSPVSEHSSGNEDSLSLYENIPAELKALPQWVGFRLDLKKNGSKYEKIPINPTTGGNARTNNPATWGTFAQATAAVREYQLDGIGFVFTVNDPYTGIDVDGCRDPPTGALNALAHDIVQRLDSYTEASPSGKGIHIIAKGQLSATGGNNGLVEMYDSGRFFTMTGEHIGGTPTECETRHEQVDALYREQFPEKQAKQEQPRQAHATSATLQEIAEALPTIPAFDHDTWLRVGMSVHSVDSGEAGLDAWVKWSETCPAKFDLDDCHKRWRSFTPDGGVTAKTIFGLAIEHGWKNGTKRAEDRDEEKAPGRIEIPISTDMTAVVDAAEAALLAVPDGPHLFFRLRELCFVAHEGRPPKWLRRPIGAPTIVPCSVDNLRERMSRAADWLKWEARSKGWKPALPPEWAVKTLLGRSQWGFPMLADVVSSPTLREDGAIISTPGYDADTGLFLDTRGVAFPPIPEQPTRDDARRAVALLGEPFRDFPLAEEHHRIAAIAAILSLVARHAINGNVPLFAVDSSTRGTGKGLLIDAISLTATGRTAPRWAQSHDDEEDRKALLTLGMEGDPCVHIDNLTHALGTGPLDSALTARTIKGRLLGLNKSAEVPMTCVFFASGNNISFAGDMSRRVIPIQFESLLERPEDRNDFAHERLRDWIIAERPRLVVEALTLLRAYFVAGCPKQGISAYGSFEEWSDLVRSSLVWAGCPDPCEGRKAIEAESDAGFENLARLLHCWHACYENRAVTINSVIQDVGTRRADVATNEWNELEESLTAFDSRYDGKRLDGRRIGNAIRGVKGRVIGGKRLIQSGNAYKVALWAVQSV